MQQHLYKNIPVAYTDSGKGTALVLLHGFLENQLMWQDFASELSKKYRVITVDLLGHGQTGCLGYIHEMEDQADLVHDLLAHLRIRKALFVGHSMGGYVALAFAELYPDFVKALVLMNSTSLADSDERKINRDRAITAVKKDHTAFVRLSIANLFSEENRNGLAQEIEQVKLQALKTPLQGIVAALEGMKIRKDREVLLHFGPYPKMLVLGEKDPVLNCGENVAQVENTKTELVILNGGHMSHIENRDEVLRAIGTFLKKV
ncbi:alpha/beta hydrolase [Flavobacterium sp. CYK-4]|uniref:alpha/beta fold hydrolase n=1 Tax=Flavobacterium lotistagni TaxID=2709660 RepID=UPI00140B5D1F|nr:alpha/beta hydrolase [Flavobacterium lotistagni]NHM06011.1 alpha/beta hydrolase [Flavobacterium lotistagni]